MAKSVDDILAGELGKLGGFLSGWVSRKLPNNIGEVSEEIAAPSGDVIRAASDYFRKNGRVLEQGTDTVTGVVGGGRSNLNPVHVTVQAQETEHSQTRLLVRAVAKEGASKQYAGEKTAPLVAEYIVSAVAV